MQNEVIAKIDALVKMSESTTNVGTLKVELRQLDFEIEKKKNELNELKSSMTDDKYFDASGEIVDKNLEISLTKKIKNLRKSLVDLDAKVNSTEKEEESSSSRIDFLEHEIETNKDFAEVLKTKASGKNKKEDFKKLLDETDKKLSDYTDELDKLTKAHEKIQGKLEVLAYSRSELDKKIKSETEKLIDVKANLLNKRGYVNNELREEDTKKVEKLESEITKLEEDKNLIVNDPVMIAEDAKNYLIDDDKTECLKKVKELKELVLQQPYMDIDSNDEKSLNMVLENAISKRDEFASMINSKNYESVDTTLINDRLSFVTFQKENYEKEIEEINAKIDKLDTTELDDLNNRINYCEQELNTLKEKIEEYEETLKDEDLTATKKANLQASFDKKQEEFDNVAKLLEAYRNDREEIINTSYELQTDSIQKLENKIESIDEEIAKLKKLSVASNKTKDVIAMENDKKALKEMNDDIKAIKRRQTIKDNPSTLYDEIEKLIQTGKIEVIEPAIEIPSEDNKTEIIEKPVETEDIINLVDNSESENEQQQIEEIKIDDLPVVDDEELEVSLDEVNENKLKVVNVEPLEIKEDLKEQEPTEENNDFLIGDYSVGE